MSQTRTVVVTGGNRGIGLATAKRFAELGHRVAITARDPGHIADQILAVSCDQTDSNAVDAAFEEI